jgi:CDP-glucose 4,6-dehydratase
MTAMADSFQQAYRGRNVLLTGHTGFKGAWLTQWLLELGANVTGYSLPSPTAPALFEQLGLAARIRHVEGDIRDAARWSKTVAEVRPDFVFHLAAQPLVRLSYSEPVETFDRNVLGTVKVLDGLRQLEQSCSVVCVTTDKCYENREWHYGYREEDPLGGDDPYSASKAAAEIAVASYRRSCYATGQVRIGSARAGNVIGGGDWALDRIVPDCVRALSSGSAVAVRNRHATRPWQHVLEPLSGYLWQAVKQAQDPRLCGAFNFGPGHDANRTVAQLVAEILRHWPGEWQDQTQPDAPHEAGRLQLTTDKANALLMWSPVWRFDQAVEATACWYRGVQSKACSPLEVTRVQISAYTEAARRQAVSWSVPE